MAKAPELLGERLCAVAGTATTSTIANIAANIVNLLNFFLLFSGIVWLRYGMRRSVSSEAFCVK